jgi:hypothetical protein
MTELFAMAVWAAFYFERAAHTFRLAPVMKTIRKGLVPVALLAVSFAPFAQARGVPGYEAGGGAEMHAGVTAVRHDGISLDEAVRRAESQFHAKVVRTDVQDEDGRKVYVLKLLSEDGRVVTVRIDAATGRMR